MAGDAIWGLPPQIAPSTIMEAIGMRNMPNLVIRFRVLGREILLILSIRRRY